MTLVPVNGIRLNVVVAGQGPPLVMLHGFTGDLTTWDTIADELSERCTTIRVDMIGHGNSDVPADPVRYSMQRCVDDLLALADTLGVEEAVWMGYSMGGRVALCLGVSAPERCRALILEGASGGIEDETERAKRVAADNALADRIEEHGIESFVDHWESLPMFASQARLNEDTRQALLRQRLGNRESGLANSLRGMGVGVQPCVYDALPDFPKPALYLAGELDTKFVQQARDMSRLAPEGKYALVPNAGHCAHLENHRGFLDLVVPFLDSLEAATTAGPGPWARRKSAV